MKESPSLREKEPFGAEEDIWRRGAGMGKRQGYKKELRVKFIDPTK